MYDLQRVTPCAWGLKDTYLRTIGLISILMGTEKKGWGKERKLSKNLNRTFKLKMQFPALPVALAAHSVGPVKQNNPINHHVEKHMAVYKKTRTSLTITLFISSKCLGFTALYFISFPLYLDRLELVLEWTMSDCKKRNVYDAHRWQYEDVLSLQPTHQENRQIDEEIQQVDRISIWFDIKKNNIWF